MSGGGFNGNENNSTRAACRGECMSSGQQLTIRVTYEPVEGTRKLVTKATAMTGIMETVDTRDIEIEGIPLQQ